MATRLTALATTHRVIVRVHHNTTVVGTTSQPAGAASLARLLQGVVGVADAAHSGLASTENLTGLTRGKFDDAIVTLA